MRPSEQNRLPCRAMLLPSGLMVAARHIPRVELRDAFMFETVARIKTQDHLIEIPSSSLGHLDSADAPQGLIFHISRCGSTLISQALKHQPGMTVYAEPLPFNELLTPPLKHDRATLIAALRSLAALFAQHAQGKYVIKFSSWLTLYADILVEAFPTTPWIFSVREPLEVAVSLMGQRPGWLRGHDDSSNLFASVVDPGKHTRTNEEFTARFIAAYCDAGLKLSPERGALIRYEQLPETIFSQIAPHFQLDLSRETVQAIKKSSTIYSKAPINSVAQFSRDDERKRKTASPQLVQAVADLTQPAYAALLQHFVQ